MTAAQQPGPSPELLAAAHSRGGVLGRTISPQNLTTACAAAKPAAREGGLSHEVLPWASTTSEGPFGGPDRSVTPYG